MGQPNSTGKSRGIPAPNSGLGQSYAQGVSGYGTGKQRQAAGPSQFSTGVRPTRGVNAGAPEYGTGLEAPVDGLSATQPYGGKSRAPTAPVVGATSGMRDEGNDIARVPRDEGNDTVTVSGNVATPTGVRQPNALANALARGSATPVQRASLGVDTTTPVRSALPGAAPAPVLRPSTGVPGTVPVRSTRGTDVPGAVATVPAAPVAASPPVQYATANSGMQPGSVGAPAAYGATPVAGAGPYDLATNGQQNWQANWQPASAAAPTTAAPFGTDDYGNAFTSAAQAADWKRRVDARNAALSDYTFADQAASRGY